MTGRVAARLREVRFLVNLKSTLEPTDSLHCLGKLFDVGGGIIANTQLSLAKLVFASMRLSVTPYTQPCLQSFMGSLQWAMQPRTGLGPMVTGPLAWEVWGREPCDGLPAGVSEALAQVLGHVRLPWPPTGGTLGWTLGGGGGGLRTGLGFERLGGGVLVPCGTGCDHPVMVYHQLLTPRPILCGDEGLNGGPFLAQAGHASRMFRDNIFLGCPQVAVEPADS